MSTGFSQTALLRGQGPAKNRRTFHLPTSWVSLFSVVLASEMALISGEPSVLVDRYAEKMHIKFVAKGTRDKATALRDFTTQAGVSLENTCFFGDDVNDLSAMEIAGLCACPENAAVEVLAHVAQHGFVSALSGGNGAVRTFADAVLAARNLRGADVFHLRPPE